MANAGRLPIVQALLAGDGPLGDLGGGVVTMTLRNPDGLAAAAVIETLVAHLAEQMIHVTNRIADGNETGATVWRLALEDIERENGALLRRLADDAAIDVAAWAAAEPAVSA